MKNVATVPLTLDNTHHLNTMNTEKKLPRPQGYTTLDALRRLKQRFCNQRPCREELHRHARSTAWSHSLHPAQQDELIYLAECEIPHTIDELAGYEVRRIDRVDKHHNPDDKLDEGLPQHWLDLTR